jgi:hypothetical protein
MDLFGMEPAEKMAQTVIKLGVIGLALIVCLACFMAGHGLAGLLSLPLG